MRQPVSVVIPTYQRDDVLVETVERVLALEEPPAELLVVDQTPRHGERTEAALARLSETGRVRWLRVGPPSIPRSMNVGLREARSELVLFLDDDVVPGERLIAAHEAAHAREECSVVAGQVLQPWDDGADTGKMLGPFRFSWDRPAFVDEFIGCNFSVKRSVALRLGGFDENFVGAAYRYEAEFAARAASSGGRIFFEPKASVRHLKASRGGVRAYGNFLKTVSPAHSVGDYYFALRTRGPIRGAPAVIKRFFRSVRTKHHLRRPWWIPVTLAAELLGFLWAVRLSLRGPRLLSSAG